MTSYKSLLILLLFVYTIKNNDFSFNMTMPLDGYLSSKPFALIKYCVCVCLCLCIWWMCIWVWVNAKEKDHLLLSQCFAIFPLRRLLSQARVNSLLYPILRMGRILVGLRVLDKRIHVRKRIYVSVLHKMQIHKWNSELYNPSNTKQTISSKDMTCAYLYRSDISYVIFFIVGFNSCISRLPQIRYKLEVFVHNSHKIEGLLTFSFFSNILQMATKIRMKRHHG